MTTDGTTDDQKNRQDDEDLDGQVDAIARELSAPTTSRAAIAEHLNRLNDQSAGRTHVPQQTAPAPRVATAMAPWLQPAASDASDPTLPVLGTLDLVEEIVATTQRYGAFAHWPNAKKSEALALVSRTVKQAKIADGVIQAARRDSVHARAYRERRRLAREAASLVRHYYPHGAVTAKETIADTALYTEAVNYLGRFAAKVAALRELPDDTEASGE